MIKFIQLIGIAFALLIILLSYRRYRQGVFSRKDQLILSIIALGIGAFSLYPGIGDLILLQLFIMKDRWMAIFIASNLLLFALFFYLFVNLRKLQKEFGGLVRGLAKYTYSNSPPENSGESNTIQVVIPAYGEEKNISKVLQRIPEKINSYSVVPLVIIDGSIDKTEEKVKEHSHPYAMHAINRGQGDAIRTGFEISRAENPQAIVTMDSDGQHMPEELEKLVKPVIDGEADFVIGSRFLGDYEKSSIVRQTGIVFFTRLINLLTGAGISDCTSGYRAFSMEGVKRLELAEDKFNAPELIIDATKKDLRIKEVPITIKARESGETKKPQIGYALGLTKTIIKTWLR